MEINMRNLEMVYGDTNVREFFGRYYYIFTWITVKL